MRRTTSFDIAFRFGVTQSLNEKAAPEVQAFLYQLGQALVVPTKLATASDHEKLLNRLLRIEISMAFLDPVGLLDGVKRDVRPIALTEKGGSLFHRLAVLVPKTKDFQDLAGLKSASAVAWVEGPKARRNNLARQMLARQGLGLKNLRNVVCADEDLTVRALLEGRADAAFLRLPDAGDTARELELRLGAIRASQVRTLTLSDPIPNAGLACSIATAQKQIVLLNELLNSDEYIHELLPELFDTRHLVTVDDELRKVIRQLAKLWLD